MPFRPTPDEFLGEKMEEAKTYYRRHMPHYQPGHATFHVVFRLAGSLPAEAIERLRYARQLAESEIIRIGDVVQRGEELQAHRRLYFQKFDALLDRASTGPRWLRVGA